MKAYISALKKLSTVVEPPRSPPQRLQERFLIWYNSLPVVSRKRRYSMSEIEAALGTQGKYLSTVLLGLGWRRGRLWSRGDQFNRYWEPPADGE